MDSGSKLGPYEILEPLGAGGMGEVWLARDTRLGREVAIKVLPAQFASDPERLARFEQEARASAALNHPNIAAVYDVGSEAGPDGQTTHFMVQEYLRGRTLGEAVDAGPLPLPKALALGGEIAAALAAAHKAGIVHRDLKPDNVFITEEGSAKVLDFGLAKLTEAGAAPLGSQSMSPTVLGTQAGSIMGTAGYMAPEQVSGEEVDHRADLFAFGCVLYELVFGERAFSGRNVMQTLDLILAEQPRRLGEWPDDLPFALRWTLGRCLEKTKERRCQSAADLVADLGRLRDDLAAGVAVPGPSAGAPSAEAAAGGSPRRSRRVLVAAGVLAGSLAGVAAASLWWPSPDPPLAVGIPVDSSRFGGGNRSFAISPDGQSVAYVGGEEDSLRIRSLSSFEATVVPGTEGIDAPFFSPDGEWVGYFAGGGIYKVPAAGGGPQLISAAPERARGATWTDDGVLLIGSGVQTGGISAVSASGADELRRIRSLLPEGETSSNAAVDLGTLSLERPLALPGSDWFLATREAFNERTMIVAISRDGEQLREVLPGWDARYAGGYLYVANDEGGLVAARFDPASAELLGAPFVLPERVATGGVGAALYDVASNGTLLFLPADSGPQRAITDPFAVSTLVWTDMSGLSRTWPSGAEGNYAELALSSNGRRALVTETEQGGQNRILVFDLDRGVSSQLPHGELRSADRPVWSPDGEMAIFTGIPPGGNSNSSLFRQRIGADPGAEPELLYSEPSVLTAGSLTPDGSVLAITSCQEDCRIRFLSLEGSSASLLDYDDIAGFAPAFSPDGTLLAYLSVEGDRPEVFVRPFPGPGGRVRVSREGAARVVWSPDGQQVFFSTLRYQDSDEAAQPRMVAATIERAPDLRVTDERVLFEAARLKRRYSRISSAPELLDFDISPDGETFLSLTSPLSAAGTSDIAAEDGREIVLSLMTRWVEQVERLAPESQ